VKGEFFGLKGLMIGREYLTESVAEVGRVRLPQNSRDWTGVVEFDNCLLLFVTLEKGPSGPRAAGMPRPGGHGSSEATYRYFCVLVRAQGHL